jgi:transglutaminase-like putative cysteine protease
MEAAPSAACLQPTDLLDAGHPDIVAFSLRVTEGAQGEIDRAVRLYLAVRDGLRYDPYSLDLTPGGMRASAVLASGRGWCVAKAGVLAACARALGIPARLAFADVRNHLATPRLLELMGTDVFYYHGCTELFLEGRWVKATPAFNLAMCERFGVKPLEFDGREDSVFHPFDRTGRRHMEYVRDRGCREDMPLEELHEMMRVHYSRMETAPRGDFDEESKAV